MFVPVTSQTGEKLMPTRPNKAGMLIKKGLATPYWSNGIFCIRLNYDTTQHKQDIVVGVDPGSKKEGFTVKSESHTYLNVQADAHDKVGKKVEKRRSCVEVVVHGSVRIASRKSTIFLIVSIPAGTRARWDWKLRILMVI